MDRRGIPAGYISSLEQRLLETEVALFEALSLINNPQYRNDDTQTESSLAGVLSDQSTRQSKEAKIEEWKRLPLRTPSQRQEWWRDRVAISNGRDSKEAGGGSSMSPGTENHQWSGRPPGVQQGNNPTAAQEQPHPYLQHHQHQPQHAQEDHKDFRQMSPRLYGVAMRSPETMQRTQESPPRINRIPPVAGSSATAIAAATGIATTTATATTTTAEPWEAPSMAWHAGEGGSSGAPRADAEDTEMEEAGGYSGDNIESGGGNGGSQFAGAAQDAKQMSSVQWRKYF
ncbi:hypothetical protein B7463_g12590, partial [Scytalidium lignicola]